MPIRPVKRCRVYGCPNPGTSRTGRCDMHEQMHRGVIRPSARERGYDAEWERLARVFMARHPMCQRCEKAGRKRAATIPHHIVPVSVAPELRLVETNLEALCAPCHGLVHAKM